MSSDCNFGNLRRRPLSARTIAAMIVIAVRASAARRTNEASKPDAWPLYSALKAKYSPKKPSRRIRMDAYASPIAI